MVFLGACLFVRVVAESLPLSLSPPLPLSLSPPLPLSLSPPLPLSLSPPLPLSLSPQHLHLYTAHCALFWHVVRSSSHFRFSFALGAYVRPPTHLHPLPLGGLSVT